MRAVCGAFAAHGDRTAVGVDADAQGSSLREDEAHPPLDDSGRMPHVCIEKNPGWFVRWHSEDAVVLLGSRMSLKENKT